MPPLPLRPLRGPRSRSRQTSIRPVSCAAFQPIGKNRYNLRIRDLFLSCHSRRLFRISGRVGCLFLLLPAGGKKHPTPSPARIPHASRPGVMKHLGFYALPLLALVSAHVGADPRPRDHQPSTHPGGRTHVCDRAPDLHEVLRRVPRHRQAEGGVEHRAPDRPDVADRGRRAGRGLGEGRRDARDAADAARRCGGVSDRCGARRGRAWIRTSLERVRGRARRRAGTRHRSAPDERRVRATRSATSPASTSRSASTRRATRSAAKASPTSATCSSCRTPPSSATSKRPSRLPITPSSAPGRSTSTPIPARPASSSRRSIGSSSSTPSRGFRVVSGEGGRPFGFDRYAKAFYVAWHYKHRAALGEPTATLRDLAAKEGITGRFAEHIWDVVNRAGTGYPSRDDDRRWQKLRARRRADATASIAQARDGVRGARRRSWSPGQAGSSRAATSRPAAPATRARSCSTTRR